MSKLFSNTILRYLASIYLIYAISFINSILIASYLGAFYLGVWGFINLVIQYLAQFNFGITHSLNSILSISKEDKKYIERVLGASISILIFLSILVLLFFFVSFIWGINIGNKFNFHYYLPFVLVVAIFAFFNAMLSNVYRAYGKLNEIIFNQISYPILSILCLVFFKGEFLLVALVLTNAISSVFIFFVLMIRCPLKVLPNLDVDLLKMIFIKGLYLFLYNTSFYLIIISTRSFVSGYFEVSEFGYFTFAFTLANAVLLLLQSFSFLIYPKLLNRFSKYSNEQSYNLLKDVRSAYITISHLFIHVAIFSVPFFLLLFPKYESVQKSYHLIALTVVLFTNSFGYQELLISRGNEKKLGMLAFICLLLNILVCYLIVSFFDLPYYLVSLGTMITYLIYIFFVGKKGMVLLDIVPNSMNVIQDIYPMRIMLPYLLSLFVFFISENVNFLILPILLFLTLNFKTILGFKKIFKMLMSNPEVINI